MTEATPMSPSDCVVNCSPLLRCLKVHVPLHLLLTGLPRHVQLLLVFAPCGSLAIQLGLGNNLSAKRVNRCLAVRLSLGRNLSAKRLNLCPELGIITTSRTAFTS
jgi:hypothetical protein